MITLYFEKVKEGQLKPQPTVIHTLMKVYI